MNDRKDPLDHKLQKIIALFSEQKTESPVTVDEPAYFRFNEALQAIVAEMHPADIAYLLESLPLDDRLVVWDCVKADRDGDILLEVSDSVRKTLIAEMDDQELFAAVEHLETDELADLASDIPQDVLQDLVENLDQQNQERLKSALSFEEDSVGALMDFDILTIRDDISLEVAHRYLRRIGRLPDHTDKLFVVDRENVLCGVLPINRLLIHNEAKKVRQVMSEKVVIFSPFDSAQSAAQSFQRYKLVTAPVIDNNKKIIGRLVVDAVMAYLQEEIEGDILSMGGLTEEEDLFSSVWDSVKNRWIWLALNLLTAFIASRVIDVFQGSIAKTLMLAALMPIVAGIGGNSGNQTLTLIIRNLVLGHGEHNFYKLIKKEIGIAFINGLLWGSVLTLFTYVVYQKLSLSLVMGVSILLNLLLAGLMGVLIPLTLHRMGKDPALGSSVLLTAVTDSGGFFIFLFLASTVMM